MKYPRRLVLGNRSVSFHVLLRQRVSGQLQKQHLHYPQCNSAGDPLVSDSSLKRRWEARYGVLFCSPPLSSGPAGFWFNWLKWCRLQWHHSRQIPHSFLWKPQKTSWNDSDCHVWNLNNSLKVSTLAIFFFFSFGWAPGLCARSCFISCQVVPAEVELGSTAFLSLFCVFTCKCLSDVVLSCFKDFLLLSLFFFFVPD